MRASSAGIDKLGASGLGVFTEVYGASGIITEGCGAGSALSVKINGWLVSPSRVVAVADLKLSGAGRGFVVERGIATKRC